MYEIKTKVRDESVKEFIDNIEQTQKRDDAYRLLDILTEITGYEGKMWGETMIGFGSYHYKYASGHQGEAMITGFSPRKAKISLYLNLWKAEDEKFLEDFGKHTKGKSCVYVNKLSDIDLEVLKKLIMTSLANANEMYPD
ncbi:MAG: DUF1801 domain-containing protein [Clostridiales bacterium]|nr:DUF1801 domain-containing protein [Clostridiales bacterium]